MWEGEVCVIQPPLCVLSLSQHNKVNHNNNKLHSFSSHTRWTKPAKRGSLPSMTSQGALKFGEAVFCPSLQMLISADLI